MYKCITCGVRWTNGFVHEDNIHICKVCGRDCSRNTKEDSRKEEGKPI